MPDIPFGFSPFGASGPDPADPAQLQAMMSQLQQMLATPGGGPVNWDLARQLAASTLAQEGDPAPNPAQRQSVDEAIRLADLWLEPVCALPSGVQTTVAWNRNEWIFRTLDVWKKLCDPVAGRMVAAMGDLVPPEAKAQFAPMQAMMSSLGGAMFGGQLGQALASLAGEVLSAGDIGLPLGPAGTAALVPANIEKYGAGLELPADEVRLYVALREAAHQRLFEHVPWLRGHVLTAVENYAAGIRVDQAAIEEAMGRINPVDPASMQELDLGGVFRPADSPAQAATLARLETALALVEGWVCHVVDAAVDGRITQVDKLAEAFRRRRAAGGPAEQMFAALVGLELRPRRLREAAALWDALTTHRGVAGRDAVWGHPDLLPGAEDFASPTEFATATSEEIDFDALTRPRGDSPDAPPPADPPTGA
ncbi:hydrolase [Pilimelia terevasa]|uniref:Hydrolase n=1 Tax=Pilimelia terevasa TaxID=53372 RepID=A0A8J3BF96_9ACTN|nr:zinc-dependent metalloprotease [Pilimelia terevasa]GGK17134.1 hydrolase [Pilimelia terevasa]